MLRNLLTNIAGNAFERELKRYREIVGQVNSLEPRMQGMSDDDLRALTDRFRARIQEHVAGIEDKEELQEAEREILEEIMPEAFAAVREASRRTIGLRHFDVQIIGGIVLHEGKIAEMKTGEGKTLVASLALYLNALTGRGAHLVTVNDYLARRDGGWMGPIFHLLGLTTAAIGNERFSGLFDPNFVDPGAELEDERLVHWRPISRRECYLADITYGTASEFGFDYLRDNTALAPADLVQRGRPYAIVDEVDSVLIDGARTPLIISGPAGRASSQYVRFAQVVEQARLRRNTTDVEHGEEPNGDYILDDRTETIALTDSGIEKIERLLPEIRVEAGESLYDPQYYELVHYLENALKAKYIFHRDKDYIVQHGRVILVDQTTGRPMPSRRYSEGLHQAIEAKEGVQVRREDVTIATITVQNYFRLYDKLAGMTGTALTQAEEFHEVYGLDVVPIPTNVEYLADQGEFEVRRGKIEGVPEITFWRPGRHEGKPDFYKRVDFDDQVYVTINGKFEAVTQEILALHEVGRPVLVGTGSVEASEELSRRLKAVGLEHTVLNAKHNEREALVVAQAGRIGAVTISTSMAGRGTDIVLGGNPAGLAGSQVSRICFERKELESVVAEVVRGRTEAAYQIAEANSRLGADVVDWVVEAYQDLQQKIGTTEIVQQVVQELRGHEDYQDIPYDTLAEFAQQVSLARIDRTRLDAAREEAQKRGLPVSLIPDIEYWLREYTSLGGRVGQSDQIEALTRRLYDRHYNARAAVIRAVLAGNDEEARRIIASFPALPESLIEDIKAIARQCEEDRRTIWELGGLHVIGTERHESRRIDDQLRGRAARQGDPGSSRFYLSLEDDLMIRFGGDRAKRMMERLNVPEDMPIAANILSGVIEQAQGRFEQYHFEIRKNLVEYDEAVNRQRQIVYDERAAILTGDTSQLDEMVRGFIAEALRNVVTRFGAGYEEWALGEIQAVLDDFSSVETGAVNTRGAVQRLLPLFPRPTADELAELLTLSDAATLQEELHQRVLDGIDQGYPLHMLYVEIARIVPPWPPLPAIGAHGIVGWERFTSRVYTLFERYAHRAHGDWVQSVEETLRAEMDRAFREYLADTARGARFAETQGRFYRALDMALSKAMRALLAKLEPDDMIEALLERVDDLIEIARHPPVEGSGNGADGSGEAAERFEPEAYVYSIGPDALTEYEQAVMLSVIDNEWRQYLLAIDDLRQGIGLEAYGQRDPKVEFKRRAFEMFDQLREGVQEEIARRFFNELPRHSMIIEQKRLQAQKLDEMTRAGYRLERQKISATKRRATSGGGLEVRRDLWSNVGRNDPCPCGSGKKFKDCHYRTVQQSQQTVKQSEIVHTGGRRKRGRRR